MIVKMGPMGKLITGHVLDVAKRPLERKLQDYDKQLYLRWNPNKMRGHGCWEVRRRPEMKSVVDITPLPDGSGEIVKIDYQEIDIVNHVMDVAYLNYDILTKLQSMDTWNTNRAYFVDQLESRERAHVEKKQREAKERMKYHAREYKREIRDFKEMLLSGLNPAELARYWGK